MTKYSISLLPSIVDPTVESREVGFDELAELLTAPLIYERRVSKKLLPCWAPAEFAPERRLNANCVRISCLVLDYDDGCRVRAAYELWRGLKMIIHTSWSHTQDSHRFRVVFPLARPVSPVEFRQLWAWAELRGGRRIDRQCKDPSRAWLRPALDAADWMQYHCFWSRAFNDGELLDVDRVLELHPVPPPRQRTHQPIFPDSCDLTPDERSALAERLGAVVSGQYVKRITCPSCGDDSVYFYLESGRAHCNHMNSCKWHGSVAGLAQ